MKISYKWLLDFLPVNILEFEKIQPENLAHILTSIGLEVEHLEKHESIAGGLDGLLTGEVVECQPHPNADKLKLTQVNIGTDSLLQIVCGASNVAKGQKVVVATPGTTIYPLKGDPVTMRVAKIRGTESFGMICAEDEIGLSENHNGIIILPDNIEIGKPASEYFNLYTDWVFEIGLTPNRMDAMSHIGVAKDVCAYFSHHEKKTIRVNLPSTNNYRSDSQQPSVKITIENTNACRRYAGIKITDIVIKPSPVWMQNRLKVIGQKPVNNIVDTTNYILHETGQPLHAFDADTIEGNQIIVKNLQDGTLFIGLDGKTRKLSKDDLMICNINEPMCIAGVFGGSKSGVTEITRNVFLESAWFDPMNTRKTSINHGLRTEAAIRFEKGVDISQQVNVLKRAVLLIKEIAGGEIEGDMSDIYLNPINKNNISLKHSYLSKLTGKGYTHIEVKKILESLDFEILQQTADQLLVNVPYNKPDIKLPADIAEEIIRIDGLGNIPIPSSINITPSHNEYALKENLREKLSNCLLGVGFNEIITNSITNSKYYVDEKVSQVKLMNSLSSELDIMRPSMLPTGLESVAYNLHRKNNNLRFFEMGKTYGEETVGKYSEQEHLSLFVTGNTHEDEWLEKGKQMEFFQMKGIVETLLNFCGLKGIIFGNSAETSFGLEYNFRYQTAIIGNVLKVSNQYLQIFDIKQPVYFADLHLSILEDLIGRQTITFKEISRFPSVQRDLAIVINKNVLFAEVKRIIESLHLSILKKIRLFDVFESEKIGTDKKSMTINFTLQNEEKTLTDKETDTEMRTIIEALQVNLKAEVRK